MKIAKTHSLGNDFLVIRRNAAPDEGTADLVRKLCDRHTGAGSDGVLFISLEDAAAGRIGFRIFNSDGTEAEISGNGLRCAAATLYNDGTITAPRILFQTTAGERPCELLTQDGNVFTFVADMGVPRFSSEEIPFDDGSHHDRIVDYPLTIQQKAYNVTCVNVGNPQCCVFVERFFPPAGPLDPDRQRDRMPPLLSQEDERRVHPGHQQAGDRGPVLGAGRRRNPVLRDRLLRRRRRRDGQGPDLERHQGLDEPRPAHGTLGERPHLPGRPGRGHLPRRISRLRARRSLL